MNGFKKEYIGFGGMLAKKRRELNITQIDLSNKLGISQSLVSKIEANQIIVDFPTAVKWLEVLKISIKEAKSKI